MTPAGFPIRTSPDHSSSWQLPNYRGLYVLHRLLVPGIHRAPLLATTRCSRPLCGSQRNRRYRHSHLQGTTGPEQPADPEHDHTHPQRARTPRPTPNTSSSGPNSDAETNPTHDPVLTAPRRGRQTPTKGDPSSCTKTMTRRDRTSAMSPPTRHGQSGVSLDPLPPPPPPAKTGRATTRMRQVLLRKEVGQPHFRYGYLVLTSSQSPIHLQATPSLASWATGFRVLPTFVTGGVY